MKRIPALLCAAAIGSVSLFSCKKDSDSTPAPPTNEKTDTLRKQYIPGWWSGQHSAFTRMYFGADSFFYQSGSNVTERTGKWWWQGPDSLKIALYGWSEMGQGAITPSIQSWGVKRLTADSVYIDIGNRTVIPCMKKDSTAFTSPALITLAGTFMQGFDGNNGPAISAALYTPADVAVDNAGNLIIADFGNELIRKITASTGILSIAAGEYYAPHHSGDSMLATATSLWAPSGVVFDKSGNFYYTDMIQNVVRKVNVATGLMTIIAGDSDGKSGTFGYNGDSIQARKAKLRGPNKVTVDNAGNIYFCDAGNYRVRRVDNATGIITTVAGNGTKGYNADGISAVSASLTAPNGIAFDKNGNLFIADQYRIRRVDGKSGLISTVAGTGTAGFSGDGGAATAAKVDNVVGVALDAAGNLFFCDVNNNRVRKVATDGTISTIAGSGLSGFSGDGMHATAMRLNQPGGIAVDAVGNVYFADYKNNRVRKLIIK